MPSTPQPATEGRPASAFQRNMRRLLRDMHIPDWDPAFLSQYDPEQLAEICATADLNAVMIYCKSHVGLCNYPTVIGKQHGSLHGRDVLGELNTALRRRGIATCGYHSINFDNWAAETHPQWRQVDLGLGRDLHEHTRYGVCCPNNPEYREYETGLLTEVLTRYEFDALWLDMIWYLAVCGCDRCRARYRQEEGAEIPTTIDWTDPAWCRFQAARERWIVEWTETLFTRAHELRPGLAVTHNLAAALAGWRSGQPLNAARFDTYTSGDLYGDRDEQLLVTKMTQHLSESQPAELMVSACADLVDHVTLKSTEQLAASALAATAVGSAFIVIDAADPLGTAQPGTYQRIGEVFARTRLYEPYLGGEPIEDVAVYLSGESQMDFADNGTAIVPPTSLGGPIYPHVRAARGACRALSQAQLPFGVITARQLDQLDRYPVLVLPGLSRITSAEVAAFRAYVAGGGHLYASRYTSLVDVAGTRHDNFLLADVFGVDAVGEEDGRMVFLRPTAPLVAEAIGPQPYLSYPINDRWGEPFEAKPLCTAPRVTATTGEPLGTLTLPYGYPHWGSVAVHTWSAIHSAPPWDDRENPVLVRNRYGNGLAVYSAFDLESSTAAANTNLFVSLVRDLLGRPPAFEAETHPAVWVNAFDQPAAQRVLVSLLNYPTELPAPAVPARLTLRPPAGRRFTALTRVPDGERIDTRIRDGVLRAEIDISDSLVMLLASYAPGDTPDPSAVS